MSSPLSIALAQLWMFKTYLGRDSALAGEEVRRLLNKVPPLLQPPSPDRGHSACARHSRRAVAGA